MEDKLYDSIQYMRKLGPEYEDQVFESARWVIEQDSTRALEVGFYILVYIFRAYAVKDIQIRRCGPASRSCC